MFNLDIYTFSDRMFFLQDRKQKVLYSCVSRMNLLHLSCLLSLHFFWFSAIRAFVGRQPNTEVVHVQATGRAVYYGIGNAWGERDDVGKSEYLTEMFVSGTFTEIHPQPEHVMREITDRKY